MSTTTGTIKTTHSDETLKTSFLYRLFLDILILISLCALAGNFPLFLLQSTGHSAITPTVGFFCSDNSLKYPYKEPTVSEQCLNHIGLQLPLAVIFIVELLRFRKHKSNYVQFLLQLYSPVGRFIFGYAAERIFKAIVKHYFLRLRPNFYEVCQPQLIGLSGGSNVCDGLYDTRQYHNYLVYYNCTSTTPHSLRSVFTSFYSGHASLVCYGMIFVLLYLQQRYVWHRTKYLQHLLQLVCLLVAWCVSLSRIWDHMNHATDVVVGALLGATFAVIAVHFIDRNCKNDEKFSKSTMPLYERPSESDVIIL